jgi:hypothetical protein
VWDYYLISKSSSENNTSQNKGSKINASKSHLTVTYMAYVLVSSFLSGLG